MTIATYKVKRRVGHPNPIWDLARRLEASQRLTILFCSSRVAASKIGRSRAPPRYIPDAAMLGSYHLDSDYLISNRRFLGWIRSGTTRCSLYGVHVYICEIISRVLRYRFLLFTHISIFNDAIRRLLDHNIYNYLNYRKVPLNWIPDQIKD